jgi:hypothetical protein
MTKERQRSHDTSAKTPLIEYIESMPVTIEHVDSRPSTTSSKRAKPWTSDSTSRSCTPSRPRSRRRTFRRSLVTIPDRTSSLLQTKKRRTRTKSPDAISIHSRKSKYFTSIDEILALTRETPPPRYSETIVRRPSSRNTGVVDIMYHATLANEFNTVRSSITLVHTSMPPSRRDSVLSPDSAPIRPNYNTVMSWTSDETRRREYEKIDRAYSGIRGFLKQLIPRRWQRCGRRDFFTGQDDDDSVRRFRVSLPERVAESTRRTAKRWKCF